MIPDKSMHKLIKPEFYELGFFLVHIEPLGHAEEIEKKIRVLRGPLEKKQTEEETETAENEGLHGL